MVLKCKFVDPDTNIHCKTQPYYNLAGSKKPIYCAKHKLDCMVNVISKTCKLENCDTRVSNKKYEGYCFQCFIKLFPDKPITRNYKTKEREVVQFIKNNYSECTLICDKIIKSGCLKKRPDMYIDFGTHIIIVEIDEYAHSNYENMCENRRVMEISQDFDHRNIVFIRFNPDEYVDKNGKKITSCWSNNKLGLCTIKKCKQTEWMLRLNKLQHVLNYHIDNIPEKNLTFEFLFYDELINDIKININFY